MREDYTGEVTYASIPALREPAYMGREHMNLQIQTGAQELNTPLSVMAVPIPGSASDRGQTLSPQPQCPQLRVGDSKLSSHRAVESSEQPRHSV